MDYGILSYPIDQNYTCTNTTDCYGGKCIPGRNFCVFDLYIWIR